MQSIILSLRETGLLAAIERGGWGMTVSEFSNFKKKLATVRDERLP